MSAPKSNPKNDRAKRDYLVWLKEAKQRSPATIEHVRQASDRLELYTCFKDFWTFNKDQAVAFKHDLLATKARRSGKSVSIATVQHVLQAIKDFLGWLSGQQGHRRRIKSADIACLNLTIGEERQAHASGPKLYSSLDEYRTALFAMPTDTEIQRRDQAIFALLLLTSMRDATVISLKLRHISIDRKRVFQDPREVKTKFRKTIETVFYPVGDDVGAIVRDWVKFLTEEKQFGPDDPLFPRTEVGQGTNSNFTAQGLGRERWTKASPIRKIFRTAFERVGLPYVKPHSIRDTLTQLAYELKLTPMQFKAWSQNMGHDKPLTTLNSYGQLTIEQQAEIITGLGRKTLTATPEDDMVDKIAERVAARLRRDGLV